MNMGEMEVDAEGQQRIIRCGFKSDRHHEHPETLIDQPNQTGVRFVSRLAHLEETRPVLYNLGIQSPCLMLTIQDRSD